MTVPWLGRVLAAIFLLSGAAKGAAEADPPQETSMPTSVVAIVELIQETNSFSPVSTTLDNFRTQGTDGFTSKLMYDSEEILDHCTHHETIGMIAGFMSALREDDPSIRPVPILQARSVSGGPILREVFDHFMDHIVKGLIELNTNANLSLDGIYLSLHGAMGVEGITDPESFLLHSIRDEVLRLDQQGIPIGVTHDLHANLTKERMSLMTYLVGYKTNPHRDFFNVGKDAGKIMVETIQGKVTPVMSYRKMRLLKGGGWTIDLLSPMRQIFSWMYQQEKHEKVLSMSNFMVHFWLDHEELGWTTVAVTDDDKELGERLVEELADMNWAARDASHPDGVSPSEAIQIAREHWISRMFGTVVFCDVSDAIGAGAPGESAWILQALLEYEAAGGDPMVSYLTLRDAPAVQMIEANNYQEGDEITLQVGAKLDTISNVAVNFTGHVYKKILPESGTRAVILRRNGIHLILNEVPAPLHSPEYYYSDLGLSLWSADIVVVKNLFPFRFRYLLYNRRTVDVVTPGVTSIDLSTIDYRNIPRPIYPLDPDMDSWRPILEDTATDGDGDGDGDGVVEEELMIPTVDDEL